MLLGNGGGISLFYSPAAAGDSGAEESTYSLLNNTFINCIAGFGGGGFSLYYNEDGGSGSTLEILG